MEHTKHPRFFAANLELRSFLRRAEALASRSDTLKEEELEAIWPVLVDLTPEVEDAYGCEMLDGELQHEIAAYVKSLRSLQQAIETIRCVMLARGAEPELTKSTLGVLDGKAQAPQQII
jgi:hypothetical protein